jgi:hypothetical protein
MPDVRRSPKGAATTNRRRRRPHEYHTDNVCVPNGPFTQTRCCKPYAGKTPEFLEQEQMVPGNIAKFVKNGIDPDQYPMPFAMTYY